GTQKPSAEQKAEAGKLLQYHVYDLPSEKTFQDRLHLLAELFEPVMDQFDPSELRVKTAKIVEGVDFSPPVIDPTFIKFVPTMECRTQEELDQLYAEYIEQGYEGQMVRLDAPYDF